MKKINKKDSKKGFSLIELMVAVAILALTIFGIFHAFSVGFMGMTDSRDRTVATNYVQEKMEELKNADFDTVVDESGSQIIDDIKFNRSVNVDYIDGETNLIVTEPTTLKQVTTAVTWNDRDGETKKVESTMLLQLTQFTPGDASRISLYADPYNVVLPVTDSTNIIAVIKDSKGNNIFDWDGSDVTFTINSGGELGTLSAYAVTPVQGKASVVLTSSGLDPNAPEGQIIIMASVTTADGLNTFTDTIAIDVTWGAIKIELFPNPSSIYADGISQSIISAIIQNAANQKVEEGNYDVTFIVVGEGTLIGTNPVTSSGGVATITLQSTTTAGIATISATSPDLFGDSCNVQTSGEPAAIVITASPDTIYNDSTSTLTIKIVDINGVPVAPVGIITVNLSLTAGNIFEDGNTVTFNSVSSQTRIFIPDAGYDGTVTITADDNGGALTSDSVDIDVLPMLLATHIELDANPSSIPVETIGGGTSVITATIKDDEENTILNYGEDVTFTILSSLGGTLSVPGGVVSCVNGIASITLESGSMPGTCQIQAASGSLPIGYIDVGFYSTADHILLTAVPNYIPAGGGNEGTSILTASVKDAAGTTVYNYDGDILFRFDETIGGFGETAKFKFVTQPNYSVPAFHGSAFVYLVSLNDSGDAVIKAEDEFDILTPDELNLYIQKVLSEPTIPNVVYDINQKGVTFDIEVLGGELPINRMMVSWSPDGGEQLNSVLFDSSEVFSGSILSGQEIDITDTVLSEGISNIYLGFSAGIAEKDITVIFYPSTSDYHASSYEINL